MRKRCILKGEDGSIVVIALMILVVLTLLGISATRTAEIEIQIARNENIFKQNLYLAECATMAGAQMLENETNTSTLKYLLLDWLHSSLPDPNIGSTTNWDPYNNNSIQGLDPSNRYMAVDLGIASGSSLDIGGNPTILRQFSIFGRSDRNHGEAIIELGYMKRF